MSTRHFAAAGATAAVLTVGAVVTAPIASAADVEKRGSCSAASRWEAEAEHDDGGLETAFEVKARRAGDSWRATLTHDGTRVYTNTRTARLGDDSSSSRPARAEWSRFRPDTAGSDTLVWRAVNTTTGEVCRATLTL